MYDTPIPIINYVMVGITASVLAYATAMDVKDENDDNSSATLSLPAVSGWNQPEAEQEAEPEPESEPKFEITEPEPDTQDVDARIANSSDTTEPDAQAMPVVGGKQNRKKHKKTTIRKKKQTNKNKRKQTRNNIYRK